MSVIVITMNRPDCLRRCLESLRAQDPPADQIIVVDASTDDRTRKVAGEFGQALYLRNELGYGHMTHSRNLGLLEAKGDVIAFLDDDAYVRAGWTRAILAPYADPTVAAVGGRALNVAPAEGTSSLEEIGRFKPNGLLTANFAADPGRVVAVDHLIGCNMSFRRGVLSRLGGLREDYRGTEVREETDVALRVGKLGYKLMFNPAACVDHFGAPQVKGKRFDARYAYFHKRNTLHLLIRNFGFSSVTWRYVSKTLGDLAYGLIAPIAGALLMTAAFAAGTTVGIITGTLALLRHGRDPISHDRQAQDIRAALQTAAPAQPASSDAHA